MMRMQQYEIRCGCGRGEITTENEPCKTGIEELDKGLGGGIPPAALFSCLEVAVQVKPHYACNF